MAKWLTLYHPRRRIETTILDTNKEKLAAFKRAGWKIGVLPPEDLPNNFVELEAMAEAGELGMQEKPKKKVKKE